VRKRTCQAGHHGRDHEGQHLVAGHPDAQAVGRCLGVPHAHEGAAGLRAHQVEQAGEHQHQHTQAQVIEGLEATEVESGQHRVADAQAVEAAGDAFPVADGVFGEDGKRQGHHGQVQARDADRRQADDQPDDAAQAGCDQQ
jgi:hypothetical protein